MTQILQPGSVPAWSGDDPASEIDNVFAEQTWPVLSQMIYYSYANSAARDAELAGLTSTQVALAYLKDQKRWTYWNGSAWAYVAPTSTAKAGKQMHWGTFTSVDVNRNDTTGVHAGIVHGCGFTPTVAVITPSTVALQFRVFNLTSTTFDLQVVNSDGSANGTTTFAYSAFFGE